MRRTLDGLGALMLAASGITDCRHCIAWGRAALRDAYNARDFVRRVHEALGIEIEVISGDEEARLSFLAVRRDPNWRAIQHIRVIDVGGGSTEIIEGQSDSNGIDSRYSVNAGAGQRIDRTVPGLRSSDRQSTGSGKRRLEC